MTCRNEIWIADDSDVVRLMLDRALKRSGQPLPVVFFNDGLEVVERVRATGAWPRLLVLDLQMRVMGGLETLKLLRSEEGFTSVPVIILSSYEDPNLIRQAYLNGARLYVRKPFGIEGYPDVAELCAKHIEQIRTLPPGTLPFGALDVKRGIDLVAAARV